ncbi:ketoacyl-ACP synthase III [Fundidesulfovibrio soli]|uniref:ketoacyl-ACP synthase III n=1 Tax=Fundidesulfovibrio soli TaxID=2922716 RepID=UPI001FAFC9EF|nr:ketoacyl-ACP synthase III [Fundidesulfovibrio soli]
MSDDTFPSRRVTIQNVAFVGCRAVVPGHAVTMDELVALAPDEKSREELLRAAQMSGLDVRYKAKPATTAGDMCVAAARKLLEDLRWSPDSVDLLVVANVTPDDLIPPTGYQIHSCLGLSKQCVVLDTIIGCSGYTHGLFLAASLLEKGALKRALLVTGDTLSRTIAPADLKSGSLLGDAGTATALEFTEGTAPMYVLLGSDGSNSQCIRQPGRGYRESDSPPYFQMDGVKVFTFSHGIVPKLLQATMRHADTSIEQIDSVCLHQANLMILDAISKQGRLPREKVVNTLRLYGNCGSASIPLALCETFSSSGHEGPLRLLLAGFGLGLSWSSVLMQAAANSFGAVMHEDL